MLMKWRTGAGGRGLDGAWRGAPFPWQLAHPLWICSFRPFFAVAVLMALGLMLLWLLFLVAGWSLPAVAGGSFVWHAHELMLGMVFAAVAGFAMTAVPEFTDSPAFAAVHARRLVLCWLLGRLGFWSSGLWPAAGLLVSAAAHLAFLAYLGFLLLARIWHGHERRHLSFVWAIGGMLVCVLGLYIDLWTGQPPMRWLHALLGVLMVLIIVAMSRISMRIVNASIEERWPGSPHGADVSYAEMPQYLARPPRRNLAIVTILLFTVMEFWFPASRLAGWTALAAAAAMFNLLNDWHVGRALLRRWPLILYAVYGLMGLGYGLAGLALVMQAGFANAGLHALTTGALGLSIYAVICIAGYTHSGLEKDGRNWIPAGALLILLATLVRVLAYFLGAGPWLGLAGLLWSAAFTLQGWHMLPVFVHPRADGASSCEGVINPADRN